MTFVVTWRLSATLEIARLEAASDDPASVRAASARIDWALRRTPRDVGESRDPGFVEVLYAGPSRRR
ncbi:MAG: hypothetical protein K2V38_11555 [Gemmataceae bacterium]|nr:hypothetical protein [Gemmataceae bacterium]